MCTRVQSYSGACFFFTHTSPTEIYTLSLHDALPISGGSPWRKCNHAARSARHSLAGSCVVSNIRSEEHTSELQSRENLVCRLLLEKKKTQTPAVIRGPFSPFSRSSPVPFYSYFFHGH